MVDSPLDSLYYMIKSVFSPALRDNHGSRSTSGANQQIQTSLGELEQILRTTGKRTGSSASSTGSILHPRDELAYWTEMARNSSNKSNEVERAKYFLELLDPIKADLAKLERYEIACQYQCDAHCARLPLVCL